MEDKRTKREDIKLLQYIVDVLKKDKAFHETMIRANKEYLEEIEAELGELMGTARHDLEPYSPAMRPVKYTHAEEDKLPTSTLKPTHTPIGWGTYTMGEKLNTRIQALGLRSALVDKLIEWNVKTIGDLTNMTRSDLLKVPSCGYASAYKIEAALGKLGFKLRSNANAV